MDRLLPGTTNGIRYRGLLREVRSDEDGQRNWEYVRVYHLLGKKKAGF